VVLPARQAERLVDDRTWVDRLNRPWSKRLSWTKNHNFINRALPFRSRQIDMSGIQLIGWDPPSNELIVVFIPTADLSLWKQGESLDRQFERDTP
jgi:hypothetical protein